MADSNVAITAGSGTPIDTQIPADGSDHRQVVVLGSPSTNARVAEVDANGRLLVAATGGSAGAIGPTQIESTSANSALALAVSTAGNVTFWLAGTATTTTAAVTAGSVTFEQSVDNTNWSPLLCVRSDTGAAVSTWSGTLSAGVGLAFEAALEGVAFVRVRPTANASSGTLFATIIAGGMAFSPSMTLTGIPAVTLAAGSSAVGTVAAPSITKATQASTGFTVQPLRDAGRVAVTLNANQVAPSAATTDALTSMTPVRDGVNGTAATAFAVTSGKRFRIQSITLSMRLTAATAAWSRFAIRSTPSGTTVATTSPIVWQMELSSQNVAATGYVDRFHADFPDGLELPSAANFALVSQASGTGVALTVSIVGFEY